MAGLHAKAALVTGGSRGIGRAIAERLAADGAAVAISYVTRKQAADDVVARIGAAGGTAVAFQADLGEAGAADRLYARAQDALGPLDILVNNAAVSPACLIEQSSADDFDAAFAVNVRAPFALIRQAATQLRDNGRIVNISTVNTVWPGPGMAAYAASKAALELLGRVASYELAGRGITVNTVLPGATETEMFRTHNPSDDALGSLLALTPFHRIGRPADVADVVALLVTEDARWLTGQCIRASGGLA